MISTWPWAWVVGLGLRCIATAKMEKCKDRVDAVNATEAQGICHVAAGVCGWMSIRYMQRHQRYIICVACLRSMREWICSDLMRCEWVLKARQMKVLALSTERDGSAVAAAGH